MEEKGDEVEEEAEKEEEGEDDRTDRSRSWKVALG